MAHTKQARKRIQQASARNEQNRAQRSELRTLVKKTEQTIAGGDREQVASQFQHAMKVLHKAARKGLVKASAANRSISRLAGQIRSKSQS